jgi:antitoxin ParD1/3/4
MPAKHALNVSVTEHLASFVAAQVASGRFGTASEVVRAALRLLERDLQGAPSARADRDQGGPAPVSTVPAMAHQLVKPGTSA